MTASWTVSRNLSTQSKACQKRNVVVPKRRNGRSRHSWRIYPREKAKLHNLTTRRNSSFVNNTRQLLSVRVFSVPAKRSAVTNSTNKQTFRNLRHFEIRKGICKLVPKQLSFAASGRFSSEPVQPEPPETDGRDAVPGDGEWLKFYAGLLAPRPSRSWGGGGKLGREEKRRRRGRGGEEREKRKPLFSSRLSFPTAPRLTLLSSGPSLPPGP